MSDARRVLVVAPHADDESFGCGGCLLRHAAQGDPSHWLLLTGMSEAAGYAAARVASRDTEIDRVARAFGFESVDRLGLPPAGLDTVPRADLVSRVSAVVRRVRPTHVYLPNPADAHSDHRVAFEAAAACLKWFRQPGLHRVAVYEVPSETGFSLAPDGAAFSPNLYVDVGEHLQRKLEILEIYDSELGTFPFPRSAEAVTALARLRGSECGAQAAEPFRIVREFW